jgi:hypothetical protein
MATTRQTESGKWNLVSEVGNATAPGRLAKHFANEPFLIFGTEAAALAWLADNAEVMAEWEAWVAE